MPASIHISRPFSSDVITSYSIHYTKLYDVRKARTFEAMTDLSKELRGELNQRYRISSWTPEAIETSRDRNNFV